MPKFQRFAAYSVARGFSEDEFAAIDPRLKRKLLRLMARIAEKSYRRGYQQGEYLNRPENIGDEWRINPADLRHRTNLDVSPGVDSKHYKTTSLERLDMECGVLRELGFEFP